MKEVYKLYVQMLNLAAVTSASARPIFSLSRDEFYAHMYGMFVPRKYFWEAVERGNDDIEVPQIDYYDILPIIFLHF